MGGLKEKPQESPGQTGSAIGTRPVGEEIGPRDPRMSQNARQPPTGEVTASLQFQPEHQTSEL